MAAGDIWLRTENYLGHYDETGTLIDDRVIPFPELGAVSQTPRGQVAHDGTNVWMDAASGLHVYRVDPATLTVAETFDYTDEAEDWYGGVAFNDTTGRTILNSDSADLGLIEIDEVGTVIDTHVRYDLGNRNLQWISVARGSRVVHGLGVDTKIDKYDLDSDTLSSIDPLPQPDGFPFAIPLNVAAKADGGFWISWVTDGERPVFTEHDSSGVLIQTVTPSYEEPLWYTATTAIDCDADDNLVSWLNMYDLDTTGPSRIIQVAKTTGTITVLQSAVADPYGFTDAGFAQQSSLFVERGAAEEPPPSQELATVQNRTTLGCPDYRVVITSRCGEKIICELSNLFDLIHGRVEDDTSEAIVVVNLKGDGAEVCCECLGNVRSWIHSMVVFRDEKVVWGPGPVVNVLYKREQVAITARDVSAWLDVRKIHNDLDFYEQDPLDIAQALINDAMYPDDPCGIARRVIVFPPVVPGSIDREYTSDTPSQYAGDALRELARTVMDFTVVGDRILLGEPLKFGPFFTLTDEDFQVDLEIEERGIEAATSWTIQGDDALGVAGGIDPYYGLVEQLADESSIEDDDQALLAAQNRLQASNPAPVYVNVPEGARLSPNAAVRFEQLVPGLLVNVNITNMCRPVYTQLRLTAVKVHVGESGDEEVGITLSPLGETTS